VDGEIPRHLPAIAVYIEVIVKCKNSILTISMSMQAAWKPWRRSCASTKAAGRAYLGEVDGANLIKFHRRYSKAHASHP
jgi:hypothetical protein